MKPKNSLDKWYLFYRRLRSGKLLTLSYLVAIVLGTALLWLPWSSENGDLSLIDALFTATSAVCVTGLTVVDTGTTFTLFGKSILLLLIQMGGLGIMTFSVLMALAIGRLPALRDRWIIESMFSKNTKVQIWDLVKSIIVFTLVCELVGVALLFTGWLNSGYSFGKAFWYGLFHSVSAFCNAGFTFFPDSLESFRGDWLINLTICGLIILGGIGFVALYEIARLIREPLHLRISLNTRLVLWTTVILLVSGTAGFYLLEANNALQGMPVQEKLLAGFMQSTTARTAGFNTVNISYLGDATILMLILLMFVGASPGSCGGGIRTTSLALLAALLVNRGLGNKRVNIAGRTVPDETIRKMISLVMLGILLVIAITMLLLITQPEGILHPRYRGLFLDYLFESVSALGTVGLSLGVTATLNTVGKILIVILMFVGRVGLVTFAYGIIPKRESAQIEYASEEVII